MSDENQFPTSVLKQIVEQEAKVAIAERRLSMVKEDVKIAKEKLESEVHQMRELVRAASNDLNRPLLDQGEEEPETQEAAAQQSGVHWQNVSTESWLEQIEPIKGLGANKKEKLCEAFPTLGDLENARSEALEAGIHLSKMMPSRIGKEITDEIQSRLIEEISRVESAEEEEAPDGEDEKIAKPVPEPQESSPLSVEDVSERLNALDGGEPSSILGKIANLEIAREGWEASSNGGEPEDCPCSDEQSRDDWLCGWLLHTYGLDIPGQTNDKIESDAELSQL